ncbi:MAG: leucine-rich repeat domain-containing protein, partial [Corallococcus sp.]|nr:leucine-rich repeat domain-containing protein [Corallococcus sp.]
MKNVNSNNRTAANTRVTINNNAFSGTSSLAEVYIDDIVSWVNINFTNNYANPLAMAKAVLRLRGSNGTYASVVDGVLPDGVTTAIGQYAFYNYQTLETLVVPSSVTSIGKDAFYGTRLRRVTIPSAEKWAVITFEQATSNPLYGGAALYVNEQRLDRLELAEGTTEIKSYAFYNCSSLRSVRLPETITSIGKQVFYNCSQLNDIVIPNGVQSMSEGALSGCGALLTITLPYLGQSATATNQNALFGYIFGKDLYDGAEPITQRYNATASETYYIPRNLIQVNLTGTKVSDYGFFNCNKLQTITLGDKMQEIGTNGFYNCNNITGIEIPASVTSIKADAFLTCNNLRTVRIYDLAAWMNITFANPQSNPLCYGADLTMRDGELVTALEIPKDAVRASSYSFYNYAKLISISLPELANGESMKITSIGTNAFAYCNALVTVELPRSITSIGAGAFADCGNLEEMTLPFVGASNNITSASATSLFGHIFGKESTSITPIDQNYSDSGVQAYAIPTTLRSVKVLGGNLMYGAFSNCRMLVDVDLDPSVSNGVNMGANIFKGCSSLRTLSIPFVGKSATVTAAAADMLFGYIFGSTVFDGTTPIDQRYGDNEETNVATYQIPLSLKSVTVHGGNILYGAFYNMLVLTELILPSSDTDKSIGNYAFYNCSELTSIKIPSNFTEVGTGAFEGCDNLEEILVDDVNAWARTEFANPSANPMWNGAILKYYLGGIYANVVTPEITTATKIGKYAFYNCKQLFSITIGKSVTSIGANAFSGCSGLTAMSIPFVGSSLADVADPSQASTASANKLFGYLFGTDSYDGSMAVSQVYGTSEITYYVPESLTRVVVLQGNVPYGAFSNMVGLTEILLGDDNNKFNGTVIGDKAFLNSILVDIVLPDSVTDIGADAFLGATNITRVQTSNITKWLGINFATATANPLYGGNATIEFSSPVNGEDSRRLIIPSSVSEIKQYAFYNCQDLAYLELTKSTVTIGKQAFYNNVFDTIQIDNEILNVAENAFQGVELGSLVITDLNKWSQNVFANHNSNPMNGGTVLKVKDSNDRTSNVTSIDFSAAMFSALESIKQYAFYGCSSLASVSIPFIDIEGSSHNVQSVGIGAFGNCENLASITVPYLGNSASATGANGLFGYIFGSVANENSYAAVQEYQNGSTTGTVTYYIP